MTPLEFTAHNIELPDGSRTMPGEPLLRDWGICTAALRTLGAVVPIGDPGNPPRVADLGCLEGGYALEFARAGYEVVGIEGRSSNVQKCEFVAGRVGLPNLHFVQDDARNILSHGTFDAVFCCGLLYHLDRPFAFLQDVAAVTRHALLLHTHYATSDDELWEKFRLSPLTLHEGRLGRWYQEWQPDTPPDEVEKLSWTSIGNSSSFWIEKQHLLQAMIDAGFPVVCEQYDFLENIGGGGDTEDRHRSFFLGLKPAANGPGGHTGGDETGVDLASSRSGLEARAIEVHKREAELDAARAVVGEKTQRVQTLGADLAASQERVRALEHELRLIKATRVWRLATGWWAFRSALREHLHKR